SSRSGRVGRDAVRLARPGSAGTGRPQPRPVRDTTPAMTPWRGYSCALSFVIAMVEWASGLPCRHSGDILRIIGISYLKNVGTNADMAGQRPTPPARILSDIGTSVTTAGWSLQRIQLGDAALKDRGESFHLRR